MSTGSKLFVAIAGMLALGLLIGSGALIFRLATQPEPGQAASQSGDQPGAPEPAPLPTATATGDGPGIDTANGPGASGAPTTDPDAVKAAGISSKWLDDVSQRTHIPRRTLQAYVGATLWSRSENPRCALQWNTLAAIGAVESNHGRKDGAQIQENGDTDHDILGPRLDGNGVKKVNDTDDGRLDGDTELDRAVGPMQFIPSSWRQHGKDGNGDRVVDPNNIDDATVTAASYLCRSGSMSTSLGWENAVRSYNNSDDYVKRVYATATNITRIVSAAAPAPKPQTVPATPQR